MRGAPLAPLKHGPGPGIEDAATGRALVIQDRLAVTTMDPQALLLAAPGASQTVGVEEFDELGVAGILIEIVDQGEIHGGALHEMSRIPLEDNTIRSRSQEAEHQVRSLSQPLKGNPG
jgi:hypothetical protein